MPFGLRLPRFLRKRIASKKEADDNKKLSYQSLRCVLEYMEANRRIYITARCPYLQNIERTIPLHINLLELGQSKVTLNSVVYVLKQIKKLTYNYGQRIYSYDGIDYETCLSVLTSGVLTPGDILIKNQYETEEEALANHLGASNPSNPLHRVNITFKIGSNEVQHRILPSDLECHVAMKKLTTYLFGRRHDIRVRKLDIVPDYTQILRLPLGLQLHVDVLWTHFRNIESLKPIIKKESFPLKLLATHSISERSLNDPIVQTAKTLLLSYIDLQDLLKLQNQKILLRGVDFSEVEIVEIVKHIMNSGKSTSYIFGSDASTENPSLETVLELIKEQDIAEITENWLKSTDKHSEPQLKSISFPISATSNLKITDDKDYDGQLRFFKIGTVPILVQEPDQKRVRSRISKFFFDFFGRFVNSV